MSRSLRTWLVGTQLIVVALALAPAGARAAFPGRNGLLATATEQAPLTQLAIDGNTVSWDHLGSPRGAALS